MDIHAQQVAVAEILELREFHRQEMNCQIICDSLHLRGFMDSFLIRVDGEAAGYGTVTSGQDEHKVFEKGLINEFYLLPAFRALAVAAFRQLIDASAAVQIQAQTNDVLLSLMMYDFAEEITSDTILFHDAMVSDVSMPDAVFRQATDDDPEEVRGEWLLEVAGEIVASGGVLTHYNPPYGDIYMGVAELHRRRGYGSYLVHELKRVCVESGRTPAARCNAANTASRKTLEKAGMLPCGRVLLGRVRAQP